MSCTLVFPSQSESQGAIATVIYSHAAGLSFGGELEKCEFVQRASAV